MTKSKRSKLIKHLTKSTLEWAKKQGFNAKEKKAKLSKRDQKIVDALRSGDMGCQRPAVLALTNALTGKDYGPYVKKVVKDVDYSTPAPLAVVPHSGNDIGHNYPLNKVAVLFIGRSADDYAVREDGTQGNHISHVATQVRPATKEEIEAIPDVQLEAAYAGAVML